MDILEVKEKVLETMKAEGRPLTAGDVANITGIDRKLVDKAFTQLKKEENRISDQMQMAAQRMK